MTLLRTLRSTLVVRVVFFILAVLVGLTAWKYLRAGEPDYLNYFRQRASVYFGLAIALGLALVAVIPWRKEVWKTPRQPTQKASAFAIERTGVGRNEPCPCGSGLKYKKCCLRADQSKAREALLAEKASELNRENRPHSIHGTSRWLD
jgi:hypothetical protein